MSSYQWWVVLGALTVLGCTIQIIFFYYLVSGDPVNVKNAHKLKRSVDGTMPIMRLNPKMNFCMPVKNVYFLRIPKTGSSTVSNILTRYGLKHKLTMSAGFRSPFMKPRPQKSPLNMVIYQHTEFNESAIQDLMPKDTVYITLLREPLSHLKSIFNYMNLAKTFNLDGESSDPLGTFLQKPSMYDASPPLTQNMLSRPFGKDLHGETTNLIAFVKSKFEHILIQEYLEESLLLLQEKLCMDMEDLMHVSLKVKSYQQKNKIYNRSLKKNHKSWSSSDYELYQYFRNELIGKIAAEGQSFQNRVRLLRRINQRVNRACMKMCKVFVDLKHSNLNEQIALEILNRLLVIWEDDNKREIIFKRLNCLLMTVDEHVVLKVVAKNNEQFFNVDPLGLVLGEICQSNGYCQNQIGISLDKFVHLATFRNFTFPINWCCKQYSIE